MSKSLATYPIVAALKQAEEIAGEAREWVGSTYMHDRFLKEIMMPGLGDYKNVPNLESIASWSADEINEFMAKHGFTIKLEPFQPHEYGVGSVFELRMQWETPGLDTNLMIQGHPYPAVLMNEHLDFLQGPGAEIGARVKTKDGDFVYMVMMEEPQNDLDLVDIAVTLEHRNYQPSHLHKGLRFPKVDLDLSVDVEWIIGLGFIGTDDAPNVIRQAKQQNIFKMNEEGALAKSAFAAGMLRSAAFQHPLLNIDRPFLLWVSRPGLTLPLFVAYVTEEHWKDPGELE